MLTFFSFSAEGGELHVVLEEDECINETSCRKILRQIVEGVLFLHSHQIAHLDIKVSWLT